MRQALAEYSGNYTDDTIQVLPILQNLTQAYLGDLAGSVPDHCNHGELHGFFGFPMHIKVMLTVYCSLLYVQEHFV